MKVLAFLLSLMFCVPCVWAQDQKITELTEATTWSSGDLLYTVIDPGGSPLSRKITFDDALRLGASVIYVAASDTPAAQKVVARYVCDGTADQTEINAALAAYRHVLLLPGTFTIAASVEVPSSTHLQFSSGTTLSPANGVNDDLIVNSDPAGGNTGITISGPGLISGNGANNTFGSGILMIKVAGLRISGLRITDCKENGIELETVSNSLVHACETYDQVNSSGVYMKASTKTMLRDCISRDNVDGATNARGFMITLDNTYCTLDGCIAAGNSDTNFALTDDGAGTSYDNRLLNCYSIGCTAENGFHISYQTRFIVDNLVSYDNYSRGGLVDFSTGRVSNSTFTENGTAATDDGLQISCGGVSVVNCTFYDNLRHGLNLFATSEVKPGLVKGCTFSENGTYGIRMAYFTDTLIEGCMFDSADQTYGIRVESTCANVNVHNCWFDASLTSGGIDDQTGAAAEVTTAGNWGTDAPADADNRD